MEILFYVGMIGYFILSIVFLLMYHGFVHVLGMSRYLPWYKVILLSFLWFLPAGAFFNMEEHKQKQVSG